MSTNNHIPVEGLLYVDIIKPTEKEIQSYYKSTGEIKSSSSSVTSARVCQKAIIKNTFDQKKYPVGSTWMVGDTPPNKLNFFGEQILTIEERNLYARID